MTQRMNMLHNIMAICVFMVVTVALIPGCTHEPKRIDIPATANVNDEISSLSQDLKIAQQDEVDLLAPHGFKKAKEHLNRAKEAREKNKDNSEILNSIGLSKAYLNLAQDHAEKVRPSAADIIMARDQALEAGAGKLLPRQLAASDKKFLDATESAEKKRASLNPSKRSDLQRNYMDLQVESLKVTKLSPVDHAIESAKKVGAKRLAPRELALTESKLSIAQNVIETDRNNTSAIDRATEDARFEANRLINITSIAKKQKVSEKVAADLYAQRVANRRLSEELSESESLLTESESLLERQQSQVEDVRAQNAELAKEYEFNESFAWAQQQFKPEEAEVYRQGDQLLIRLKGMNYKPGQSELPSNAYAVLNKVKDIIVKMGAEKVKVEGHTDSLGKENLNKEISKARAESVADYLVDGKIIGENQVEVEGIGSARPLSPNNSAKGRADNRRVDIIVTPSQQGEVQTH